MQRANTGYIGEYDFNISGNINNRVYLGLTVGVHDVHYNGVSEYSENIVSMAGVPSGKVVIEDERHISGTGFDVKLGVIFRPIEASPFRVGLSVATPTFYELKTENTTRLRNGIDPALGFNPIDPVYVARNGYKFKLNTPWKFGLSLGHTIDSFMALGASLEYADYGSIDTREITGEYYDDWYGTSHQTSKSDNEMNRQTKETLKGVATVKLGAEIKVDPKMSIRFGYNYLSPMYKSSGTKNFDVDSYGTNCASATDFTNWKETHRLTCGLGFRIDKFNVDLAYQYSACNGDFWPFQNAWADNHYIEDGQKRQRR